MKHKVIKEIWILKFCVNLKVHNNTESHFLTNPESRWAVYFRS